LQKKQQCGSQLVLMEPIIFCDDCENQILKGLRTYIEAVPKLAEDFDAVLVPLQSRIDEQIKQLQPEK